MESKKNAKIKIHILHLGDTLVDESVIFNPEGKKLNPIHALGLFRSQKHKIKIPVTAYLIEHPKGKILIDTGFHKDVRRHPIKDLTLIHFLVNKPLQNAGEAVDEVLLEKGVQPSDLDFVILTHLHTDHAGGLRLVKDAKRILVSEEELRYAEKQKLQYVSHMWKGVKLETFRFADSKYGPVNKAYDLFGDESIILVYLPGHTPGLAGTLIRNNEKFVLLTSDSGYARKSWERMILPGVMSSREDTEHTFQWQRTLSKNANCIDCLATHETELSSMVYEF
ncbi:N-acyl homoserine lactonase family protein [Leptospira wolffii]|uniref:N-acyl homoserine lactonase family protein n=1 Tax=Leptospira wolffii TaxID=409998 RepID=UPI0002F40154|nr:N-acyl homoserine lactonase family protein [Leptospira wolffii]EPG65730.1 metallo-beta-lactamase domain protein [Leptospira wolffii serovar Khorat str. Khorat-H2]